MTKVKNFEDLPETRNLSGCRQLLTEISTVKENILKIKLEGVTFENQDLGGYEPKDFEISFNTISGFISEIENCTRIENETKKLQAAEVIKSAPSLQIKPLKNSSDWLQFRKVLYYSKFLSKVLVNCPKCGHK